MINSNLKSVQINKYIIDKKEKKVHTLYRIELVTTNDENCYVYKRYKEFEALHNELKKNPNFENLKSEIEFPKSYFYTSSPKTYEFRRTSLDNYMKKLLKLYKTSIPVELAKFFNLEETFNINEAIEQKQEAKANHEALSMPQISIKNLSNEQLCFALCKSELKEDIVLSGFIKAFYSC